MRHRFRGGKSYGQQVAHQSKEKRNKHSHKYYIYIFFFSEKDKGKKGIVYRSGFYPWPLNFSQGNVLYWVIRSLLRPIVHLQSRFSFPREWYGDLKWKICVIHINFPLRDLSFRRENFISNWLYPEKFYISVARLQNLKNISFRIH